MHVVAVSGMLVLVMSANMVWSNFYMETECQRLPLPSGWQESRMFQWGRQNGCWMLMPTFKNRGGGHMADSIANTCANRFSSMPLQPARVSMTVPSHKPRRNHHLNESLGQNPQPWSFWPLTPPPARTLGTCIGMCTNSRGHPKEADAKLWRSTSVKRSSTPLRNASGQSSHPHSWRGNRGSCWQMLLSLISIWSLLLWTMACMRSSLPQNGTCMRKWWPLQGMPTNRPWQQPQSLKKGRRESAAPPAANAPAATNAPAAAGGPGPWDIKKEIPRWLPTMGNLMPEWKVPRCLPATEASFEGEPNPLVPPGRSIRWPFPKVGHPLLTGDPECNARVDEAHQLPLPIWWNEQMSHEEADWSRPMEEGQTAPVEDEDLECPPATGALSTGTSGWGRAIPSQY